MSYGTSDDVDALSDLEMDQKIGMVEEKREDDGSIWRMYEPKFYGERAVYLHTPTHHDERGRLWFRVPRSSWPK